MWPRLKHALGFKEKPLPTQRELEDRLLQAAIEGNVAAIQEALQNGAKANIRATCATTPLHKAALTGCTEPVRILVEAGAKVDARDVQQFSALHYAAGSGSAEAVKILLEAGAEVDARSDFLNTPLHWASSHGQKKCAELLLAAGADLTLTDKFGDTPIQVARYKHPALADCLQAIADNPAQRPTPESVGLDMDKRAAALQALGKPPGAFTEAELKRAAQRKTREAQRQAALRGEGI